MQAIGLMKADRRSDRNRLALAAGDAADAAPAAVGYDFGLALLDRLDGSEPLQAFLIADRFIGLVVFRGAIHDFVELLRGVEFLHLRLVEI